MANVAYEQSVGYQSISGSIQNETILLPAPTEDSNPSEALNGSAALTLNGKLDDTATDSKTIGSVKVTVKDSKPNVILETTNIEYCGKTYTTDVEYQINSVPNMPGVYDIVLDVKSISKDGVLDPDDESYVRFKIEIGENSYYASKNGQDDFLNTRSFADPVALTTDEASAAPYLLFRGISKRMMRIDINELKILSFRVA